MKEYSHLKLVTMQKAAINQRGQFDVRDLTDSQLENEYDSRKNDGKNYYKFTKGINDLVFELEYRRRGDGLTTDELLKLATALSEFNLGQNEKNGTDFPVLIPQIMCGLIDSGIAVKGEVDK